MWLPLRLCSNWSYKYKSPLKQAKFLKRWPGGVEMVVLHIKSLIFMWNILVCDPSQIKPRSGPTPSSSRCVAPSRREASWCRTAVPTRLRMPLLHHTASRDRDSRFCGASANLKLCVDFSYLNCLYIPYYKACLRGMITAPSSPPNQHYIPIIWL
jgi:hypothetical protein